MNKKICISSLLIILTGILSCVRERTPVEPSSQPDPHVIKGNAKLENQTDHYGIFVYLEGLKIYTLTDSMGNYTLTIPDSLFSGDTLTVQGKFHIYYSFPYYKFDSTSVVTDRDGFVFAMEDLDKNGRATPVELSQVVSIKTVTDKTVYTPDDSLWVQVTCTNCSNQELYLWFYGGGEVLMLFDKSVFWSFSLPSTLTEKSIKLIPKASYMWSNRVSLVSIRDSRWGISFPWTCRVWALNAGIQVLYNAPHALKGIVDRDGWFRLGVRLLNLPLGPFDLLMRDSFSLPEITIIDN